MGIVEAAAIGALVVSLYSANEQRQAAKESAEQQKEGNRIRAASQRAADIAAMRQKAREERIRRARIQQAAENAGVGASSGEIGALSALQTGLASAQALQTGQATASNAITSRLNKAASAEQRGANWAAIGQVSNTIFGATSGGLFSGGVGSGSTTTPTSGGTSSPTLSNGRFTIFD